MPLIARPEHGTFYGVMGQRESTLEELQALQDACGGNMRMMHHCRQCRSDAIGMLGQDRSAEFSRNTLADRKINDQAAMQQRVQVQAAIRQKLKQNDRIDNHNGSVQRMPSTPRSIQNNNTTRPVLVAVASKGGGLIKEHFGHAREFLLYEASPESVRLIGHRKADLYCSGLDQCGEAERVLAKTI